VEKEKLSKDNKKFARQHAKNVVSNIRDGNMSSHDGKVSDC